jgi:CRP/FNR family transcriptional regulator, cyclic AMP receptor protein
MERRGETLDDVGIFSELAAEVRRGFAGRCTWRDFKPRQQIVGHQEDRRNVFFLITGKARASIYSAAGRMVTFRDIRAGDMFGEFSAIDGEPRSASVEATQRSLVAIMSPDLFWEVLRTQPPVMAAVLKRLTGQVRTLSERVYEMSTLAVRNRIHAELLRLAKDLVSETGNAVLYPAPTDADIAARIATTRETVNRELGDLVEAGLIEKRGRTLVIRDVERLRRLVDEVVES